MHKTRRECIIDIEMTKAVLRRIFAWIALAAAVCATVFLILYFFNITGELAAVFGTVTLALVCVVAVFFILAKYVLSDAESGFSGEAEAVPDEGESGDGETAAEPCGEPEADENPDTEA